MKRNLCLLIGLALLVVLVIGCNSVPYTTPMASPNTNDMATPDRSINPTMPSSTMPLPTETVAPSNGMVPAIPES